jgi:protease I
MGQTSHRVLLVIAPVTFRDEEYAEPKRILENAGVEVTTASTQPGTCVGRFGLEAFADVALCDVDPSVFDAIAFVGGGGARIYFDDEAAHRVAREALDSNHIVGAICIAPSILGHAGLLDGVCVTSFPSQQADLTSSGASWTGCEVEVDGRLVTASGPEAASAFARAILELLDEA